MNMTHQPHAIGRLLANPWSRTGQLLIFLAIGMAPAWAQTPAFDAEAMLPYYCRTSFMLSPQGAEFWKEWKGKGTQHYCYGLTDLNKAYMMPRSPERDWKVEKAIGEMNYTLTKNPPEAHFMAAEMYLSRGLAQLLRGNDGAAVTDFFKAIQLQPGLAKAYVALADYYSEAKQTSKALETVTQGLRHAPKDKSLQRRYKDFGGKLPYPEPIASKPVAVPGAQTPPSAPQTEVDNKKAAPVSAPAANIEPRPQAIGTPSNPWCRFCPEPATPVAPRQ